MIGQSQSGHGQGPRPWSRSKAMVKFQSEPEFMSTRAAAAAGSGGQRRAAAGSGRARGDRARARVLGTRCGGNQDFFSVSSNPGRGGKKQAKHLKNIFSRQQKNHLPRVKLSAAFTDKNLPLFSLKS